MGTLETLVVRNLKAEIRSYCRMNAGLESALVQEYIKDDLLQLSGQPGWNMAKVEKWLTDEFPERVVVA